MPNLNRPSNKILRDQISKNRLRGRGPNPADRLQSLFIEAASKYPRQPVPVRYAYKATTGGRLPVNPKGDECKVIKKEIKRLRMRGWNHQGMPLVYINGPGDNAGYRLCVDEDDRIENELDKKLRQVDTRTQDIKKIVEEINPRKVKDTTNLERLDRGRVVTNQLLLPEADMEALMKNAERARNRMLLKSASTSSRKAAKKTTSTDKRSRSAR